MSERKKIVAPAPSVDTFTCVEVSFLRGEGTPDDVVRKCYAYYRLNESGDPLLIAVYDPEIGIDPMRFPPGHGRVQVVVTR